MNAPPKLDTPEAREAYRQELRGVAMAWRMLGIAIVIAGSGMLIFGRLADIAPALWLGGLTLAVGWVLLGVAIVKRTLYHRRRMRPENASLPGN